MKYKDIDFSSEFSCPRDLGILNNFIEKKHRYKKFTKASQIIFDNSDLPFNYVFNPHSLRIVSEAVFWFNKDSEETNFNKAIKFELSKSYINILSNLENYIDQRNSVIKFKNEFRGYYNEEEVLFKS